MNLNSLSVSSARGTAADSQPLTLREGQMIHGKVQQLFPGQMAQVQVGSQQLFAKLEVPMQAGDTYYFKVSKTEPEVQLQVISGPMREAEGQAGQLTRLMDSLNLPKTPEMKELLANIIKHKIPMTKENMMDAASLLKSVPENMKAEALSVIGKMAGSRLPFTPAIFQSLLQAQTGTIAQQITTLQSAIQSEPNLAPAVREQIQNTLQALTNPVSQATGRELLNQSISQLLDPQAGKAERFAALQLLKNAGVLPARTSLANLPQVIAELVTQPDSSKATGLQSAQLTASAASPESAPAIRTLLNQLTQTPVSDQQAVRTIVQSIAQQLNSPALSESVKTNLQQALAQFAGQPVTDSSKASLVQQMSQAVNAAMPEQQTAVTSASPQPAPSLQTIQTILSQLSQTPASDQQSVKTIIQNLAQQLNSPATPESVKNTIQPLLAQFTEFSSETAKTVFIEQASRALLQSASAEPVPGIAGQPAKELQQTLLSLLSVPPGQTEETLRTLLHTANDNPQMKQLLQAAETQLAQSVNGPVMKEAIQNIMGTLGINYEAQLNSKEPELANLANTLKPQLLAMLQDPSLSPPLREAAETMVLRMNGTIIQTADTSLQQQLIMQLPVELFGKKIDATLQWNGRMKDNGQIDPAFARILFYLDLESLSTTLVDMHVQNKVVNLTIFNEQPSLRTEGLSLQPLLKEGLEGVGYKLSGITFKPFKESRPAQADRSNYADERGVDYRI